MRNYNTLTLSPLKKFAIGFDNIDKLMENFLSGDVETSGYPPYNIEKLSEDEYKISMAVAGFSENEIEITVEGQKLLIQGSKAEKSEDDIREFIHRGIAERSFEQKFELEGHIKVKSAEMQNGLLNINLKREIPEEMKPKKIEIKSNSSENKKTKSIEKK